MKEVINCYLSIDCLSLALSIQAFQGGRYSLLFPFSPPQTGLCMPQVLDTDEAAFKAVSRPTLFYLPHCPASMSHNLVAANWQPSALPRLAMLGNGFVATAAACNDVSAPRKEGGPLSEAILELVGADAVVDVPVKECNFPVRGAFNDTSVMLFSPSDELLAGKMQPLDLSHLL